jgi:hypothetical protein
MTPVDVISFIVAVGGFAVEFFLHLQTLDYWILQQTCNQQLMWAKKSIVLNLNLKPSQ